MKEKYFRVGTNGKQNSVPYVAIVVISIHVYTLVVWGSNLDQQTGCLG
jgi:hypothetical protein